MNQASAPPDNLVRQRIKGELRTRMQSVRRALPKDARRKRSEAICERLSALKGMDSAQSIAVFCPMRYEPNIIAFIEFLWRENKRVSAPRIRKEDDTLELRLFSSSNEQLEKHRLGGLQPTMNAELVSKVDIIIVPALAIDERGFRIGYGRGYYDKLLASETSAMAVGIIFDFQRVLELPNEAHDMPVSWIVTDACELNVAENQQMRHK